LHTARLGRLDESARDYQRGLGSCGEAGVVDRNPSVVPMVSDGLASQVVK
jgi:hypothetical protein